MGAGIAQWAAGVAVLSDNKCHSLVGLEFSVQKLNFVSLFECRVEIDIIRPWLAELLVALTRMTHMVTAPTMLALLPLAHHVSFM